jgi:hypothetical protein
LRAAEWPGGRERVMKEAYGWLVYFLVACGSFVLMLILLAYLAKILGI